MVHFIDVITTFEHLVLTSASLVTSALKVVASSGMNPSAELQHLSLIVIGNLWVSLPPPVQGKILCW